MASTIEPTRDRPSKFLELGAMQSLGAPAILERGIGSREAIPAGIYLAARGSAEFVDYREYVPGEDLRRVDWKVLGRTGRPYVRLYQDETNLLCTMLVDASSSMLFAGQGKAGSISKLAYVQYLSTAFSYLITAQRDHVGLGIVADGLVELIPPAGTPTHLTMVQKAIESIDPVPSTNLTLALRQTFDRLTRRGVLVVMSDFLVDDVVELYAMLQAVPGRGDPEVVLLHIVHPQEVSICRKRRARYRFEGNGK